MVIVYLHPDLHMSTEHNLSAIAAEVISEKFFSWVSDAEKSPPYHQGWDSFGLRSDRIIMSEGWKQIRARGISEGLSPLQ